MYQIDPNVLNNAIGYKPRMATTNSTPMQFDPVDPTNAQRRGGGMSGEDDKMKMLAAMLRSGSKAFGQDERASGYGAPQDSGLAGSITGFGDSISGLIKSFYPGM